MNSIDEIDTLKTRFEIALQKDIETWGEKNGLLDACKYSLLSGGKRVRPLCTLSIAQAISPGLDTLEAALAIEYMHTASLIIDDLPCMDNDDYRRGMPSVHKVFGETTALLASYALMNLSYEKIYRATCNLENSQVLSPLAAREAGLLALREASYASGLHGATGGQFLDLFSKNKDLAMVKEIFYKKTVTLFEASFLFGWLFGGGESASVRQIKEIARHFGMAFQIADDLQDQAQDRMREESVNVALLVGLEKTHALYNEEIQLLQTKSNLLPIPLNLEPLLQYKFGNIIFFNKNVELTKVDLKS